MKRYLLTILALSAALFVYSQPKSSKIKVMITPNSEAWNYKLGENVKFDVLITANNIPLKNTEIVFELSYDMMKPFKSEKMILKEGKTQISAGTMRTPGFLRCRVFVTNDGNKYEGRATAGFEPEKIQPTAKMPDDFNEFWGNALNQNAKIPMLPRLTLLPERCTEKVNVYELSVQNFQIGSHVYGILCVPKGEGKFPAILQVPGAGFRPYQGEIGIAESGIITLQIGIHGIPVTMNGTVYDDLNRGALTGYPHYNMDDRDKAYFKRVFLGCVRAVDYIFSMKEFDGKNIVVQGGSQGGALSIVTAALDKRITGLAVYYPGLCDLTGYYNGRAGGWPHMFKNADENAAITRKKIEVSGYYDVVNFARNLDVPGFYTFGYNDMICAPTSVFSALNQIKSPRTIEIVPEAEHFLYPETSKKSLDWVKQMLGITTK